MAKRRKRPAVVPVRSTRTWGFRAEWLRPSQEDAHEDQGQRLSPRARLDVQKMIDASIAQAFARLLAAVTGEG